MNKTLLKTIQNLDVSTISIRRKETLQTLIDYIQEKLKNNQQINLNFICTHNSRRSHLSQVWMQTLAHYFDIKNMYCYSGGTEATAIYKSVLETLNSIGFDISKLSTENNPVYSIKYDENELPIIGFSKTFDHSLNPKSSFAAIMTCSQADEGCPFIAGAEKRIPITYDDPKAFDNTSLEKEKYKERSTQIATEFYYVLSQLKK